MSIRTAAAIAMITLSVGLCFWLFVRPLVVPTKTVRVVNTEQLVPLPFTHSRTGIFMYEDIKDEVREWSKILANFAPVISLLIAYFLKGRKK